MVAETKNPGTPFPINADQFKDGKANLKKVIVEPKKASLADEIAKVQLRPIPKKLERPKSIVDESESDISDSDEDIELTPEEELQREIKDFILVENK